MGPSWAEGGKAPQALHHAAPGCLAVIDLKGQSLAPPSVVRVWNADQKAGPGGRLQGASPGGWAPKLRVRLPEPREGGSCGGAGFVARAGSTEGGAEAGPGTGGHRTRHSAGSRTPRMASSVGSGFPARTNSRLDAFLRRHLAPKVYDAIRAYESCVVVSESEKHTFKYVVLSDRLIYLTENPPKSIRRVVALRDVVAIDLVRSAGGVARTLSWAPQSQPSCTRQGGGRPSPFLPRHPYSLLTYPTASTTEGNCIAVCRPNKDARSRRVDWSSPIPSNRATDLKT